MSGIGARDRQAGAALLLVLWLIMLLTALVGAFALTARIEHLQGQVLSRGVVGEQAARAGLEYALLRVVDPDPVTQWPPDGRPHPWQFGGMPVQVRVVDESGKIDLNAADQALLAGLMTVLGAEHAQAEQLAAAIADWRDPDDLTQPGGGAETPQYLAAGLPYGAKNAPFETVSELELVLGMPSALYERMAAHVTVFSGMPSPDPRYAGGEVLRAMGLDPEPLLAQREPLPGMPIDPGLVSGSSGTYSIDSRARLPDGREARLRAVVRLGAGGLPGAVYAPLRWEEGASAPDDG